jgi:hypothetical protein
VGALVILTYLLGGLAVEFRLRYAGGPRYPLEGGLAVIPRDTLLLIGIRDFAAMILAAAFLVYFATGPRRFWTMVGLLLVFAPHSFAGYSWVLALIGVRVALAWRYNSLNPESSRHIPDDRLIKLAVVVALAAGAVVLVRYTDPPNRFSTALALERPHGLPDRPPCIANKLHPKSVCVSGVYLGSTSDTVFLARPTEIVDVPKSTLLELRLFKTRGVALQNSLFSDLWPKRSVLNVTATPLALADAGRPWYDPFG